MRNYLIILFTTMALVTAAQTQKFTLSGQIKDGRNGEDLIGASVFEPQSGDGTVTNLYGFYSLTLPEGNYRLEFSYVGYSPKIVEVQLHADKSMNVELNETGMTIQEVVVTAEREDRNVTATGMSREKLAIEKIKTIPVVLGEVDVIKAIQLLPGVQNSGEGQSSFYVRGGGGDQNVVLLDEAPVYNASHLLGIFSVFNADAVKDVQLYKGGIPASYGGRLSSVLDIRMKDGNNKQFSASGGIGTISSRLTLEAPLANGRGSFIVAGRRTYFDAFLAIAALSDSTLKDNKLYFYDLNLKANYRLTEKDRIFLSGYFGRDAFSDTGFNVGWGNGTGTLRWNHIYNKRLFSNLTFIYSKYNYSLGQDDDVAGFKWDSDIKDYSMKLDFNYYLSPKNSLRFGYQGTRHHFSPGFARGVGSETIFNEIKVPESMSLEHGLYVENEQQITNKFSATYGIRASLFQNVGKTIVYQYNDQYEVVDSVKYGAGKVYNHYFHIEPRLGLKYQLDASKSVKASYNRMVQYLQLASNSQSASPFDIWFPSSPNVKPQLADQVAAGYFQNFRDNAYEASVEIYYKKMQNSPDFKDYAEIFLNKYLEGEMRFGEARAYGAEFLLKKNKGQLTGWLGYTLSKSERRIDEINNGKWYETNYSKTHNITLVANYTLNKRSSFAVNFVYVTGAPTTFPIGRYEFNGQILPVYGDRNASRMPDFHRMDVSYILKSKEKPGRKWSWDWNFSVYNVYNKHNPYTITFKEDDDKPGETYAQQTYIFPIMPSITWNFKF